MTGQVRSPTRRDLRLAETGARGPRAAVLRAVTPRRRRHASASRSSALAGPVALGSTLILVMALIGGGIGQARAERAHLAELAAAQQQRVAIAAAEQMELARQERIAGAVSSRLSAQGAAYAAARRNEALTVARAAVEAGGAVVTTAAPVVSPDDLTPLDEALVQLVALIETAPAPTPVEVVATDVRPPAPVAAPHHDGELLDVNPVDGTAEIVAGDTPTLAAADVGTPAPAAASAAPTTSSDGAEPVSAPDRAGVGAAAAVPAGAADPALEPLDLALSAQLVATAQQVTTLSAQVEAVAAANIAASEAAAQEAAARAAAEQAAAEAAAAERARKVRRVAGAQNGKIHVDDLCRVSFDRSALMRCDAAEALEELNTAFHAHFGRDLDIDSSYRDLPSQVSVKAVRGDLAAHPGTSNHGHALAVDFGGFGSLGQFTRPTYLWMRKNAPDYGWYHPSYMQPGGAGPAEPWHWEFGEL